MTYSKESFVKYGEEIGAGIGISLGMILGMIVTHQQADQKTQQTTETTTRFSTELNDDNLQISIQEENKNLNPIKLPGRECKNTSDIKITQDGNTTIVKQIVIKEKPVVVTQEEVAGNLVGGAYLGYYVGSGVGYAAGYLAYYGVVSLECTVGTAYKKLFGSSKKVVLTISVEDNAESVADIIEPIISDELNNENGINAQELTPMGDSDEA